MQKFNVQIDRKYLVSQILKIKDWREWEIFKNEFFKINNWPETPIEEIEKYESKSSIEINKLEWFYYCPSYWVEPELYDIYNKTSMFIFEKLENYYHDDPDDTFGKECSYCSIWTRNSNVQFCPLCANSLIIFPINYDENGNKI